MKQKIIGIYQIRNLIDDKRYIGSSIDIKTRWTEHKYDLKNGIHRNKRLQNAYNKYGKENFVYEILETLTSDKNLRDREQFWITTTGVCNKKVGYNIQRVVELPPPSIKKVICLETKEIFNSIKEAGDKYYVDPSSISCCCNKRKLKQAGGYHWLFYEEYVKLTKEEIHNIIFNVKSNPFICLDDEKIYRSWRELPYKKGLITRCCNLLAKGKYATCDNKKYMYLKDYNKLSITEIQKIKELTHSIPNSGEIICLETKKIYKHAQNAMLLTNINSASILDVCYKKAITANKLHWMFKSEYDKLSQQEIKEILKNNNKCKKSVTCLETKVTYDSGIEASKITGISPSMVSKICKNHGVTNSKNSLHFMFTDEYKKLTKQDIAHILNKNTRTRQVRCIETGIKFNSVTEAAKSVHDQTPNISKCCKNSKKTCKGYHWEYI